LIFEIVSKHKIKWLPTKSNTHPTLVATIKGFLCGWKLFQKYKKMAGYATLDSLPILS